MVGSFGEFEGDSIVSEQVATDPLIVALSKCILGACASQALPLVGVLRFAMILISSMVEIEGTLMSPMQITQSWKSSTTPWWLKKGAPNNRS
jgi:hypothetical protein